jgi:molybdopterin-containing oxidoreductase family membrane subunit
MSTSTVKGVFAHLDYLMTAIDRLDRAGFEKPVVTTPLPRHDVEEALYRGKPSPVRWWTLAGAITGLTIGITLTSFTAMDWPMTIPGGKPLVALTPYVTIIFECTILLGALFTTLGLLFHCRLPTTGLPEELKDPRFSDDHFGLFISGLSKEKQSEAHDILTNSGAVEVVPGGGSE